MKIIKRNGSEMTFDIDKIVDAISKACIRAEEKKVEERIKVLDLFSGTGGVKGECEPGLHSLIYDIIDNQLDMALGYFEERPKTLEELQELYFQYLREIELEKLEKRRQELRTLRRIKTERVSAMIKNAWIRRNLAVGRSSTSSVTDPMLLSIPTPPTSMAANCSLGSGGTVIAF